MHVTDTVEMLERAYETGRMDAGPDLRTSTSDPSKSIRPWRRMKALHVVFVQYCPYQLADASGTTRDDMLRNTRHRLPLRGTGPNFKDLILHAEIRNALGY